MKKTKGFTLTETVISIAIMGLVIITVLGVFAMGNNAIKKGRSIVIATNIAEKKISEVRNLLAKYPDYITTITETIFRESITSIDAVNPNSIIIWNASAGPPPVPMAMTPDTITITGTEVIPRSGDYSYTITIKDYIDSSTIKLPDLKKVDVEVRWLDPPSTIEKKLVISSLVAKE